MEKNFLIPLGVAAVVFVGAGDQVVVGVVHAAVHVHHIPGIGRGFHLGGAPGDGLVRLVHGGPGGGPKGVPLRFTEILSGLLP